LILVPHCKVPRSFQVFLGFREPGKTYPETRP
jgi:hypothetical protein